MSPLLVERPLLALVIEALPLLALAACKPDVDDSMATGCWVTSLQLGNVAAAVSRFSCRKLFEQRGESLAAGNGRIWVAVVAKKCDAIPLPKRPVGDASGVPL